MADILQKIDINTSPEAIYAALTTEKGLASWWTPDVRTSGDTITFGFGGMGTLKMKVETLEPNTKVVWRCVDSNPDWDGTLLTWNLEETATGTALRFSHRGWREANDHFAHCQARWGYFIHVLKDVFDTKALALRYWQSWQNKDWATFRAALSDTLQVPGVGGPDAFTEMCKGGAAWKNVELLDALYFDGRATLVYQGFDVKQNKTFRVSELITFENGKITKLSAVATTV